MYGIQCDAKGALTKCLQDLLNLRRFLSKAPVLRIPPLQLVYVRVSSRDAETKKASNTFKIKMSNPSQFKCEANKLEISNNNDTREKKDAFKLLMQSKLSKSNKLGDYSKKDTDPEFTDTMPEWIQVFPDIKSAGHSSMESRLSIWGDLRISNPI